MSSRKQADSRNRRYVKQKAGYTPAYAYEVVDGVETQVMNPDGTPVITTRPNRALRRLASAMERKGKNV